MPAGPQEGQVPRAHGCHTAVLLQAHHFWDQESHGGLASAQTGFACPCPRLPPHPIPGPLECVRSTCPALPGRLCFPPYPTSPSASPGSSEQPGQGGKSGR